MSLAAVALGRGQCVLPRCHSMHSHQTEPLIRSALWGFNRAGLHGSMCPTSVQYNTGRCNPSQSLRFGLRRPRLGIASALPCQTAQRITPQREPVIGGSAIRCPTSVQYNLALRPCCIE